MQAAIPSFMHRRNYNGSFSSVCTKCFQTVSTNLIEVELEDDETSHLCTGLIGCSTIQKVNRQLDRLHFDQNRMRPA